MHPNPSDQWWDVKPCNKTSPMNQTALVLLMEIKSANVVSILHVHSIFF